MANLLETCELAWEQVFPMPNDETAISKESFIATGRSQYAWEMWRLSKEEKAQEGVFNVPSNLLTQDEFEVNENEIDLSGLPILRSLTNDTWLINIGGLLSPCKYVASNVNLTQLLDGDDSLGDLTRTYLVIGNKIQFPKGVHKNPLPIIYANNGISIDESEVEIDDMIAAIIRTKLIDIYSRKGIVDETNNSTPNS